MGEARIAARPRPRPMRTRIEHLNDAEQRVLRLAANRLGEKGEWNLDELKMEFEELLLTDAPRA